MCDGFLSYEKESWWLRLWQVSWIKKAQISYTHTGATKITFTHLPWVITEGLHRLTNGRRRLTPMFCLLPKWSICAMLYGVRLGMKTFAPKWCLRTNRSGGCMSEWLRVNRWVSGKIQWHTTQCARDVISTYSRHKMRWVDIQSFMGCQKSKSRLLIWC